MQVSGSRGAYLENETVSSVSAGRYERGIVKMEDLLRGT